MLWSYSTATNSPTTAFMCLRRVVLQWFIRRRAWRLEADLDDSFTFLSCLIAGSDPCYDDSLGRFWVLLTHGSWFERQFHFFKAVSCCYFEKILKALDGSKLICTTGFTFLSRFMGFLDPTSMLELPRPFWSPNLPPKRAPKLWQMVSTIGAILELFFWFLVKCRVHFGSHFGVRLGQ